MSAVASARVFSAAMPETCPCEPVNTQHAGIPPGYSVAYAKSVFSGDTVVLCAPQNPTQSRTVSLAWLNCARLATSKTKGTDQPWAFEARETLRRAIVGREVIFAVEYTVTASGRDFCTIKIKDSASGSYINVASILLAAGHAKLRDGRRGTGNEVLNGELEQLHIVEGNAQQNCEGLWDESKEPRTITLSPTIDKVGEFLSKYKHKAIRAIVEHVRDGSCVRVRLMPTDSEHYLAWIYFSGIKVTPESENQREFNAARNFVEFRLLQRDVQVTLESQDNNGIVASVLHPKGNIAEFLLREGLARIVEWSLNLVSLKGGADALRAAEKVARDNRINTWAAAANHESAAGANNTNGASDGPNGSVKHGFPEPKFKGVVTRIINTETILVQSSATGVEYRISFASVRSSRKEIKEVFVTLAREWLRSRLIGKAVEVLIDYVRPPQSEFEERVCSQVTAYHEGKGGRVAYSVAEEFIRAGFATVLRHRRTDDQRASNYDVLLAAEEFAIENRNGIHNPKVPVQAEVKKISETHAKAKQYLAFLQRTKSVRSIVEHVISGTRIALQIPQESMRFTMVLSGIRVPRQGEKWSQDALTKSMRLIMQREVTVEIESLDMTAAFVGNIIFEGSSLAVKLVEAGLANVHPSGGRQNTYATELFAAEAKAKEARLGIWENYETAKEQEAAVVDRGKDQKGSAKIEKQLAYIYISEYVSPFKFFIHSTSDSDQFEEMMKNFGNFHTTPEAQKLTLQKAKRGEIVSARYTADNQWYRAKIQRIHEPTKSVQVLYIDYGNMESVPIDSIRALPAQFASSPPKAQEAVLSYVKQREMTAQFSSIALERFKDLTRGKKLIANIDRVSPLMLTLFDPETAARVEASPIDLAIATSINAKLLSDGCAILDARAIARYPQDFVAPLQEAFDAAREDRRCMWQYGNIEFDEENQDGSK